MKKTLSALLAAVIAAGSVSMLPSAAASSPLLAGDFESGLDGWTVRGTASVARTQESAASGTGAAAVTNRSESWCGISHTLDPSVFVPGNAYSFSASVMQKATAMAVHFKLSLQYSTGGFGGETYDCIAEGNAASGMWLTLSNLSYTIPANAQNMSLYLETEDSKADFLADAIAVTEAGKAPEQYPRGDVNHSGAADIGDVRSLRDFLLGKAGQDVYADGADLDGNSRINAADLTLLKRLLMAAPEVTTAAGTEPQPGETTVTQPESGEHADPKSYMEKVRSRMTDRVPDAVQSGDTGTTKHFTYYSKKANREKGANIWLPAGYTADKKYPVLYMNHGVMGDENGMLQGFSIREMASNLIASGEAVPFIIVFPQMYTDPNSAMPGGFTMDTMDRYDDFIYDLTESLMPYVAAHYSVKTGRENTAIAGFSMGGRESLYIGISKPELFGYVCASSPAPGVVPGQDFMTHLGSYIPGTDTRMQESDFRFSDDKLPYLLMLAGGTNDTVVGTFPKQYHELFTKNGTDHIWTEVPGGAHDGSVGIPLFYNFFRAVFQA